jgi:hypothetical protein
MLELYTLFHCNLAFSMIPREHFPTVVERCYSPLLDLAEKGFPIAIEMTAWTLKEVNRIDPSFIERLRSLWQAGKCEFIGSGYSQAIFPLIPTDVNRWNLEIGNRYYQDLLGRRPRIALVNEQTFSRGLVDLYREAGYDCLIMDWNNSHQHNHYPKEYLYHPQRAAGLKADIDVLWSHSIAFQKFQRCVHGEITCDEYLDFLFSHAGTGEERVFPLYTNDAEVFSYRPGHDATAEDEYKNLEMLLKRIAEDGRAELTTPSRILASSRGQRRSNIIKLESVETPVVCKKQDKYNPLRWAAAGRDSVHINTECHKVYESIRALIEQGALEKDTLERFKEVLCELWGSDFRTNTIDEKFAWFQNRLGWLKIETERLLGNHTERMPLLSWVYGGNYSAPNATRPLIEEAGVPAGKGAAISSEGKVLRVDTGTVVAEFKEAKGHALKSLTFPQVSPMPLVGTLAHGHYEDISLGADFFSGHVIHTSREGKKTTDLSPSTASVKEDLEKVTVEIKTPLELGTLWKKYEISKTGPEVKVTYRLKVNGLVASSLRAGIFTFMPSAFDRDTLWFETVNGGAGAERFYMKGHALTHDEPVSQSVSASSCLGATEGWLRIGDSSKSIEIQTDKSKLFTVPMLKYLELPEEDSFFLRVYHSLGEFDDTAWWVWRGYNEAAFTLRAARS